MEPTKTPTAGQPNQPSATAQRYSHIATDLATDRIRAFLLKQKDSNTLEAFFRDILPNAAPNMANGLKHARKQAAEMREAADVIENRQIDRLIDDVIADWTPAEIYHALDSAENGVRS